MVNQDRGNQDERGGEWLLPRKLSTERHVYRDVVGIDSRVDAKCLGIDDIPPEIVPFPANAPPLRQSKPSRRPSRQPDLPPGRLRSIPRTRGVHSPLPREVALCTVIETLLQVKLDLLALGSEQGVNNLPLEDGPMELVDALRLVLEELLSILLSFLLRASGDNDVIAVVLDRLVGVVDLQFRDAVVGEVVGELVRQRFAHGVYDRDGNGLGHRANE